MPNFLLFNERFLFRLITKLFHQNYPPGIPAILRPHCQQFPRYALVIIMRFHVIIIIAKSSLTDLVPFIHFCTVGSIYMEILPVTFRKTEPTIICVPYNNNIGITPGNIDWLASDKAKQILLNLIKNIPSLSK